MLNKLEKPYAEMDKISRHLFEKRDVEPEMEKHDEKNALAPQTIADNLSDAKGLPTEVPQICAPKLEVDGHKLVFTYPLGNKFSHSVMLIDGKSQEARLIENPRLDVNKAKSVLVKKALIVLKEGSPVEAYKYTSFDDPINTVKSILPTLPSSDNLESFSVCKLPNLTKVILSGGWSKGEKSAKVHVLDTSTKKWKMEPLPDLNIARNGHSSTCHEYVVYVACGWGGNGEYLNSVERL